MFNWINFRLIVAACLFYAAAHAQNGANTDQACEGSVMHVTCSGNEHIRIRSAFYGRADMTTCTHATADTNKTNCASTTFPEQMMDICSGRQDCKIPTDWWALGDPCPGTYKYVNVSYDCMACANVWNETECSMREGRGECQDPQTRDTMIDNCFQTCSGCTGFSQATCNNTYGITSDNPDFECDRWAFAGECNSNPDWMLANCKESCRNCRDSTSDVTLACEGDVVEMHCQAPHFIHIQNVTYGRFDLSFCESDTGNVTCPVSDDAHERVERACEGRRDCQVLVNNRAMDPSDPCPGQPKQAVVAYSCQLCQNVNNTDCRIRAEQLQCLFNRDYMRQNCFKECSGCREPECDNEYESDQDCDYWAMQGECESNAPWMTYRCPKSCQTCDCQNDEFDGACDFWASNGECESNAGWMPYHCAKSCETCHECFNSHGDDAQCESWANSGECRANPFWMLYKCEHACYACGDKIGPFSRGVCEGTGARLHCDNANQKVRITDIFYGRRNNDTCPHATFDPTTNCTTPDVTYNNVTTVCNGHSECVTVGHQGIFDDPCPGVTKQLEVTFICQDCMNKVGDAVCGNRTKNECFTNQDTMLDECFQFCTDCTNTECINKDSDILCDFWAMRFECLKNPGYMLDRCARSCSQDCP